MILDDVIKVVAQLGFPIFVAVYLLVRFDALLTLIATNQEHQRELLGEVRDLLRLLQEPVRRFKENGGNK